MHPDLALPNAFELASLERLTSDVARQLRGNVWNSVASLMASSHRKWPPRRCPVKMGRVGCQVAQSLHDAKIWGARSSCAIC